MFQYIFNIISTTIFSGGIIAYLNAWYEEYFGITLNHIEFFNTYIFDFHGGSGKTTLANKLKKDGEKVCSLDSLKFGENWVRKSDEEFYNGLRNNNAKIIEGALIFKNTPKSETFLMDVISSGSDNGANVILLNMPLSVAIYRKLWRSFKRMLHNYGIIKLEDYEVGVAVETCSSVWAMIKGTVERYNEQRARYLNLTKRLSFCENVHVVSWPFYVKEIN